MITRIWHGRTAPEHAAAYLAFLLHNGIKGYRQTPGNQSIKIWTRQEADCCHFYTVTEWESLESIKQFAGNTYEKAVYYPEDNGVLLAFEETVQHYETHNRSKVQLNAYLFKLQQLFDGGAWVGESIAGKLDNMDATRAFTPPTSDVHSIAEIVWHCIYWRKVVLAHLQGDHTYQAKTMDTMNFLPVDELKAMGWERLKKELRQSQHDLLEILNEYDDNLFTQAYLPGYSYEYLLDGLLQHDAYHLGQIGLVNKIIHLAEKNTLQ